MAFQTQQSLQATLIDRISTSPLNPVCSNRMLTFSAVIIAWVSRNAPLLR